MFKFNFFLFISLFLVCKYIYFKINNEIKSYYIVCKFLLVSYTNYCFFTGGKQLNFRIPNYSIIRE